MYNALISQDEMADFQKDFLKYLLTYALIH